MKWLMMLVALCGSSCVAPTGPTGLWLVTTKFPDGQTVVSTCHSERKGAIVICEPALPFRVTR